LRSSADRLREIAKERPAIAARLRSLAASIDAKASEIEASLQDDPTAD
jgi:hypothetical protein